MNERIRFTLEGSGQPVDFSPVRVIIAGYTGRNQAAVKAHIDELAAHGIPAPSEIPTVFRTTLDRLTQAAEVEVIGSGSSGEAEVVLLVKGDQIWVSLGSDHTDRELEKLDIPASKQACPKPVASHAWLYSDVRSRWDSLVLKSWVGESGREQLYQDGTMAAVMKPEDLLAILRQRLGDRVDGAAIYTGTLPLIGGKFSTRPYFEAELSDPSTGTSLRFSYKTRRADA